MTFGKVLRMLRTRSSLTQKQLADVLGVSESRIGMYERGHREPDFEMLEAIADYFNVDMDFLTGRSEVERQYTFMPCPNSTKEELLTEEEHRLIRYFQSLNSYGQSKLLDYSEDLITSGRYSKDFTC